MSSHSQENTYYNFDFITEGGASVSEKEILESESFQETPLSS